VFNLYALGIAGRFTERIFGNGAYLAIYLLSGVAGSVASIALHPMTVSVGASGAIFGVYGALLAFVLTHQGVLPQELLLQQRGSLFSFLAMNLLYSLRPGVDLAAHAGGLATGMVCGLLLARDLSDPESAVPRRIAGAIAVAVCVALGAFELRHLPGLWGVVLTERAAGEVDAGQAGAALADAEDALKLDARNQRARIARATALMELGRFDEANSDCQSLLRRGDLPPDGYATCAQLLVVAKRDYRAAAELLHAGSVRNPNDVRLLLILSDVADAADQTADARAALDRVLALAPDDVGALDRRAWQRIEEGDSEGAMHDADRTLALSPGNAEFLNTRCFALTELGRVEEALADCKRAAAGQRAPETDGMIAFLEHRNADAIRSWRKAGAGSPALARHIAPWIAKASTR
jgi:tetratricopeptide (TPR) repeat protein